jgi:hypothetical protein
MRKILRTTALLALVVACPTAAAAQAPPAWASKVKQGKALFVMTTDGEQIEGKAGPVSREGLVVTTSTGPRFVRYDGIFRAERKDSAWSGLAYGAAIGFGVGMISWKTTDCAGEVLRGFCEGFAALGLVMYTPAAALLGWGIDAAVTGRRTVFEASAPVRVSVAVAPSRAAVAVTW